MAGQTRNTSTPPPGLAVTQFSQPRSSPTPPPSRPSNFEPSFYAQQQAVAQVSLRPAYESGFVLPPGFDATQVPQAAPRATAGYDRPMYENSGPLVRSVRQRVRNEAAPP